MRHVALALALLTMAGPAAGQESGTGSLALVSHVPASAPARLSLTEQEEFLRTAKIEKVTGVKKGVTGTQRATLSDGAFAHDASIQSIDESKQRFETARRLEFNFRDYWGYNVAAYRLGLMLGLDMIPPSVGRIYRSQKAAFTWWVDDVLMDEMGRQKGKVTPPDPVSWNAQIHVMRVFDELIANTDRNQGNMLIDKQWRLWLIDHSRAFRTTSDLRTPTILRRCERSFLERLRTLSADAMKAELKDYLTEQEMAAVLKRRDKLVAHIETLGPTALYEFSR